MMTWKLDSNQPLYLQIVDRIRYDIVSGRYSPGEKFPTVRELALEAGVNPNTMQRALAELESRGLLFSQRTTGRFVTEDENVIRTIRRDLAREQVWSLIQQMNRLGFGKEETLGLINSIYEEATHG